MHRDVPRRLYRGFFQPLQFTVLVTLGIGLFNASVRAEGEGFQFETNDVISMVGGANFAAAQEYGYLDVLLAAAMPDRRIRLRNQSWEGDTVYTQPRELNFGSWSDQFKKARTTAVFAQFGQMESLDGPSAIDRFVAAYDRLLDEVSTYTNRIVLISPFPFEKTSPPLPDLSTHNADVARYVEAIRQIARRRHLMFVDLFRPLQHRANSAALTRAGMQLTAFGQWVVAREAVRQLGTGLPKPEQTFPGATVRIVDRIQFLPETGALTPQTVETLRQSILTRNRMWFDYWRPMNWAFLAGDRTEQPSSRDHRDPRVRWFPAELGQFLPLIETKDREIAAQTTALAVELK